MTVGKATMQGWLCTVLWTLVIVVDASLIGFHVSEELPSGTPVGNVKTSSNITGQVGEGDVDNLQFHILSADGLRITSIFSINSKTGAIFTNAMIDREQLCDLDPVCKLDFDVTVKTNVTFVKLLAVRVIVDDVNDNAPTFPKGQITLSVPESAPVSSEIPISGALDRDAGLNATISYSLQLSTVFGLKEVRQLDGSSALKLVVQRALDREAVASYSFLILASDGVGPEAKTGTLTVGVLVTDVNDNVPQFSTDTFELTVMETAPVGTVFGHLTASDGDVGDNGKLSYRFSLLTNSQVTDLFALNATSGELSVTGGLQYESGKSFQCVVEVMDLGVPPQVSQAILRIHVADAGNTPPKLDLILADPVFGDQSAMLSEDVQMGTFVGTLKAEDLDEGAEGQVNCSSQDSHFSLQDLDTNRYGIVVSQPLDREKQQEMSIVLLCSDNGDPQLTSSTTFKVILRDVNDNPPKFTQRVFQASLTENRAGEQYVTRVVATDDDDNTNSVITYYLDSKSYLFTIDPLTGKINTTGSFDRELTPFINVTVYAIDSGIPALTGCASVFIRIADVNDNAPYINRSDYYVNENLPVGDVINISVVDLDEGENGTVMLSLSPDLQLDITPFSLLANGSFTVQGRLDRERQSIYIIPLTLRDQGHPPLSATATLTIQLVDSNDQSPLFLFPSPNNNTVTVMAHLPVGSHICQILASDSDMGSNGEITYSITEGNSDQWLGINNQTGHIFVIRSLMGVAGSTLHLQVAASDQGTPPLVTHTFLDVFVKTNNSALLVGSDGIDEDKYIIIAGVIAGITFVVAVVVVAVIIHMRNTDLRRQVTTRAKGVGGEMMAEKDVKLGVLCSSGVVLSDASKHTKNSVTDVDGSLFPHNLAVDNGGFESSTLASTSTQDRKGDDGVVNGDVLDLQCGPPYAAFVEGPNRLVSEDHNSDTSGESTTCDSGRGASDEEIIYPLPSKSLRSTDPPPRLPPREPLFVTGQWSRDVHVVSTNWSIADSSAYITEEDMSQAAMTQDDIEIDESSFPGGDVRSRCRRGPLRVRFSFDDGDSRSKSSMPKHQAYPGQVAQPDITVPQITHDTESQPYISLHLNKGDGPHTSSSYPQSAHRHFPTREQLHTDSSLRPHNRNGDTYPTESLRLNPESMYPTMDRFPKKQDNGQPPQPGWDRQKTRNSDSLSSLAQSVDDDMSTTTSGSYSIDFDDVMNVSLEC